MMKSDEVPASKRFSTKDPRQALPTSLFRGPSCQNIFIVLKRNGKLSLYPSSHVGHQFFKSLTELNRKKFVESLGRSPADVVAPRLSLSVVSTICNDGKGRIYFREDREPEEWLDMGCGAEANKLVFETMACSFNLKPTLPRSSSALRTKPSPSTILSEPMSKPTPTLLEQPETTMKTKRQLADSAVPETSSLPPKKRVRFVPSPVPKSSTRRSFQVAMDAAQALMNITQPRSTSDEVHTCAAELQGCRVEHDSKSNAEQSRNGPRESAEPSRVTSSPPPSPPSPPPQSLAPSPTKLSILRPILREVVTQRKSVIPADSQALHIDAVELATAPKGIRMADIRDEDVLCGGRGQAVLAINHPGNKRFRDEVQSHVNAYAHFDRANKLRLAEMMVRFHIESTFPKARFLVMSPSTELWYPISMPKTLGKAIRTFKLFEQHVLRQADQQMQYLEQIQVELVAINRRKQNLEQLLASASLVPGEQKSLPQKNQFAAKTG